ncbi:hydroxylase [Pseudoclavibacter sp. RFBJ3]|uniref:SDR family oxidoreductase n=1 Tax=unclassified Pseudoclavibacter TaxID=2615177 RepID=UPI000CE90FFA|nr:MULTISPECIES: NmrA family NAD(P)-binding protein [unclassified Pseudoclavibacter]PPF87530.1 hydroxylase [Pseudoclavibacter sp. RFBJ5]PPF90380.1 hydroxylase [Pseudoclavibacter sp. RFBJ3]PPG01065.1 hydroxylase [Pseudoclavibacter sp. RFBH5]PPG26168.1 hydroxylase [Pseudoclavibacter sp. RFBI4]
MTYLIHGATGAQGAPVVAALTAAGLDVTAAVRTPSSYSGPGVAAAVDFADTASLTTAYRDIDGLFIHLPIGSPAEQLAVATAVAVAAEASRPARVVVSTSGYTLEDPQSALAVLVRRLEEAGISTAVVQPRLYLENLLLPFVVGPVKERGVLSYPLRADYAVSWSSHLDVADVVVGLLQDSTVTGTVSIGALPGLLGEDLAQGFAAYLGQPVNFESNDPDDFGRDLNLLIGPGAGPVVESYKWRASQPDEIIDEATSAQRRLGIMPRSVTEWLAQMGV